MNIQREKRSTVKVGYIGLGRRGMNMLQRTFLEMKDVEITWICDLKESKIEKAMSCFREKQLSLPRETRDYREVLADGEVDAVVIMTGWNGRVPIVLDSMRAGKYTAVEVGTAYDLSECYDLVKVYEETQSPLMMLENCCYGRREMMALRMVREGLFGEVVHCEGGYMHYLNKLDLFCSKDGVDDVEHYRAYEYLNRNCEQYPTHELGPIAKVLDINRGNRMVTLTSTASKSRGLESYIRENVAPTHPLYGKTFAQGDVITTVIRCERGETIVLTLDTTLPRPYYSRAFTVRGTKGCCIEAYGDAATFYLEGMEEPVFNNEAEFYEKYDHPLYAEYSKMEALGGHGGVDWLVVRAFIESVKAGTDTPIDAYDTAAWMAIGPLSAMSIAKGSAPVDVPDFTRGKWFRREEPLMSKYSLDAIVSDPDTPIAP